STYTSVPKGITLGSTAITFLLGSAFKSIPVDVTPEHPLHSAVYAVAVTVFVSPFELVSLLCSCSLDCSTGSSFSAVSSCSTVSTFSAVFSSAVFSSCFGSGSCATSSSTGSSATGSSVTSCFSSPFDASLASCFTFNFCPSMITEEDKLFHAFKLLTETPNSAPISLNVSPASTLYVSASELVFFLSVAPSILSFCPGNIFVESILL